MFALCAAPGTQVAFTGSMPFVLAWQFEMIDWGTKASGSSNEH
jgi:hypothetical protein